MEFENVIRDRYSCRKFSSKMIEDEKLEKILEAGRIAPTAKNLQPFKILVVKSLDGIAKIDEASPCRYGAPCVLVVCGDTEDAFHSDVFNSYEMDSSIVATHMILEATNLGVNNIWIELFDKEMIQREFDLDESLVPVCLLPMGYADEEAGPSHKHFERKELEEIVEYR